MAFPLFQLAKSGYRLAPIGGVLIRHGFGYYVTRLRSHAGMPGRPHHSDASELGSAPKRFRMVCEELGPTFIKFGQMLSTRADLLPESWLEELRKLTDHVPPFDSAEARRIIESDLKRPISELFREFSDTVIASGSIGQIHHAVLHTGESVVVKVRRPNIQERVLADLNRLELLAPLADRFEELRPLRIPMIVDEFHRSMMREIDFVSEASFTTKIGEALAANPRVKIPKVHWQFTTSNVLVLEQIDGVSLNAREELAKMDLDRKQLARDLTEVFLHQYFKSGIFHADPHSGNILITRTGHIALVDFGMAGRLTSELRAQLSSSFIALANRDLDIITDIYLEIGALSEGTDIERLKTDLQEALDKYYGIPIRCLDLRHAFSDAMRVARVHGVLLPRDFVLLGKSFVTMTMMAKELDPEFDLAQIAKPYALSLVAAKFSPKSIGHDMVSQAWYVGQMVRKFPRDMRALTRKLLNGSLQVTLHMREFEGIVRELDRATNRLAFSILVAAIVIGSSVLLHAKIPPHVETVLPGALGRFFAERLPDISALGLCGFLFAGVLGMLLAIAIWRSGRL